MKLDIKTLQREFVRMMKEAASKPKEDAKRKRTVKTNEDGTVKRNSGFQKPTNISNALADFLKVPQGTPLPRMEVTRMINNYIKVENLQNPKDRRKIIPDQALLAILGTSPDVEISYFNYQSFLKGHFLPTVVPVPVV
jgi:chromatin remodeling complex protein RSC6